MQLYAIRRRSGWAGPGELAETAAKSAHIGESEMRDQIRWIRSYVVAEQDGRLGTICIYEARDEASIRDHAIRVGMPADEIDPVVETVVIAADPTENAAA